MEISPNSAFTTELSDGSVVLKLARYADALGMRASTYGLPIATSTNGSGRDVSASKKAGKSPAMGAPVPNTATMSDAQAPASGMEAARAGARMVESTMTVLP